MAVTLEEITLAQKNIKKWLTPTIFKTPLTLMPARSQIHYEPLGATLIIAPWNYPFQLLMSPLIGSIAAGNCAVVKPSELAAHTSQLIHDLLSQSFAQDYIKVVTGGVTETTALLQLPFDHIFFTGSTTVGKIVMQAAAQNLVPVTLELGGKSPTIVCEDADLDLAARRIVWGKFYNAGQTCVAPDYLYVHESVAAALIDKIQTEIKKQFGDDPQKSEDLACIINVKNVQRLSQLLDASKVIYGGEIDVDALYVAPTLLTGVTWHDPIMREEIFGPILPILTYSQLDQAFEAIRSQPKPLSAYLFSQSRATQKKFTEELSFGGGCINDVVIHVGNPYLPFGGVGASGMGAYHGEHSFKTFSHAKSVMTRYSVLDLSARYAPYTAKKLNFLKRLFGKGTRFFF